MKNNPCENCICNVDEYCRCEKLSLYETYQQGKAEGISECLEIVQKIKDEHIDSNFIYPINYGTLCGIIIQLERLKNG